MSLFRSFIGAAAALLLSAGAALGHHAFSADFDANKPITLDGIVTKVELTNPHAYLYLDVNDQSGRTANWKVELASSVELANRWTETTLTPDQHVTMRGWRGKNEPLFANADSIMTDSGHKLSGASYYYLDFATGALARNANEPRAVGTSGDQDALPATASPRTFIGVIGALSLLGALAAKRAGWLRS